MSAYFPARTTALQDLRKNWRAIGRGSVLECGCPLPLKSPFVGRRTNSRTPTGTSVRRRLPESVAIVFQFLEQSKMVRPGIYPTNRPVLALITCRCRTFSIGRNGGFARKDFTPHFFQIRFHRF